MGVLSAFHAVFALAIAGLAVVEGRWILRKARLLGSIFAIGLAARVITSLVAFGVLYYHAGILSGLHVGDGFWTVALDARLYYGLASEAAARNPLAISGQLASPQYLTALAVWMTGAGISVLSAILFNVACYMVTAAVIVADPSGRGGPPPAWTSVVLAAFTFSPMLLLSGTQVLKDPFFTMLVVVACRAAFQIFDQLRHWPSNRPVVLPIAIGVGAIAAAGLAGVRPYYAAFVWLALGAGLASLVIVRASATVGRLMRAGIGVAVMATVAMALVSGSPAYYRQYRSVIVSAGLFGQIQTSRHAFAQTGGATNMAASSEIDVTKPLPGVATAAKQVGTGLLAIFVPMTILRAASVVTFSGGRGLMLIADLDTVFLDATMIWLIAMVIRRHALDAAHLPAAIVAVTLAAISAILLAYVVTNFGTLLRLRLMVAAPAWMLVLALETGAARAAAPPTRGRPVMPPGDLLDHARP